MGPKGQANYHVCKAECLTTLKSFLANKAGKSAKLSCLGNAKSYNKHIILLAEFGRVNLSLRRTFFLLVLCCLSFCSRAYLTQTMFLLSFSVCGEGMIHLFFFGANYRDNLL